MENHLWKCEVTHPDKWAKKQRPVYAVEESKPKVITYVNNHLKDGYIVGKVSQLGKRLGMNLYHS